MEVIRLADIRNSTHHSVDPAGMVFFREGKVYRAIKPEAEPLHREIMAGEYLGSLFEKGLIETTVADLELEGHGIVLEHRKIPFVSYPTEWCGEMLKSAALLTLELNRELAEHGLELKDAHPWNVLFDGCDPVFVDFGSIQRIQNVNEWKALREFVGMFLHPIRLMSAGFATEVRSLYIDKNCNKGKALSKQDVVTTFFAKKKFVKAMRTLIQTEPCLKMPRLNAIDYLHKEISRMSIPLPDSTWSDYCHEEVNQEHKKDWIQKRKTVDEILGTIRANTLLDIGSNTGWFSKLASSYGFQVIAFDLDDPSVNRLFLNEIARERKILPLVMNFRKPTPAYGIELRCKAAIERYKCDVVLGLAIVHHLCFTHKMTFAEIIGKLAEFSNKFLIIEFIPKDDIHVAKWIKSGFEWYTAENFKKELKKHFVRIREFPSNPAPRSIFLCEK